MMLREEPMELADPGVPGGVLGGQKGGVSGGVLDTIMREGAYIPPPRPVEAPAPVKAAPEPVIPRLRQGGLVHLASPIRRVEPVYPPLARQARIEGVVQLEGIVGIDGRLHELRALSGHPFLVKAAMDAVQQWLYTPGTLNGERVEVIAPITVTFRLGER
jgi:protein TonB